MDVWELRCWFKHKRFLERVQTRELHERVIKRKAAGPGSKQPAGTMTEMVRFIDPITNAEVAEIHRFRLPTGELGASGKEDPKYIVVDGVPFRRFPGPFEAKRDPCVLFPSFV
jgi:hypothetical protein